MVRINGEVAFENSDVAEGDKIEILDYYVIEEILEVIDMPAPTYFLINGKEASWEERIYDGFDVECVWEDGVDYKKAEVEQILQSSAEGSEAELKKQVNDKEAEEDGIVGKMEENVEQTVQSIGSSKIHNINVLVNDTDVVLSGKTEYLFVDVLDFYPFDTRVAKGSEVIMQVNGLPKTFADPIQDGDRIDLYWKE